MIRSTNPYSDRDPEGVDADWLASRFDAILQRLASLEQSVTHADTHPQVPREYYSTHEFAELVGRSEYTVREWCRHDRVDSSLVTLGNDQCTIRGGVSRNFARSALFIMPSRFRLLRHVPDRLLSSNQRGDLH
ncbi:MAG: hypothetical protein AAGJ46_01780 [Planctomycetota bacterium]